MWSTTTQFENRQNKHDHKDKDQYFGYLMAEFKYTLKTKTIVTKIIKS